MLFGSIEAGGTKFVCAVGDQNFQIKKSITFPTTTPKETLDQAVAFLNVVSEIERFLQNFAYFVVFVQFVFVLFLNEFVHLFS